MLNTPPTPLEIPVTIQGAKPVEGSDRRELFSEKSKTELVFQNGAVLCLQAKIVPGQCVFLRNDLTGREIMCKVLERREAGQAAYADLEFTAHDPEFWNAPAEQPAPAVDATAAPKIVEAAPENPVVTSPIAFDVPVAKEISAAPPQSIAPTFDETFDESQPQTAPPPREPAHEEEWDEAKDGELLASLIARDVKPTAKRQAAAEAVKETDPESAAEPAAESPAVPEAAADVIADTGKEAKRFSLQLPPAFTLDKLTAAKKPIGIGIAALVVVALVLGVARHAKHSSATHHGNASSVASVQTTPNAQPAAAPSQTAPPTPTNPVANNTGTSAGDAAHGPASPSNNAGATPATGPAGTQQGTAAQASNAAPAQTAAATATKTESARANNAVEKSAASAAPNSEANNIAPASDQAVSAPSKHRKSTEVADREITAAKILSQAPPSIPSWAKGLDIPRVVELDALIDEKGNIAATKPLSGPRLLHKAAQRAVALWTFEPAQSGGKPTATHMVLTVQFQN